MFLIQELAIVPVPRRSLLQSTAATLGLTVHRSGAEGSATGNVVAWVEINLPWLSGEVHARRRVFRGQPSHTLAAAKESASQSILDYLCTHYNILLMTIITGHSLLLRLASLWRSNGSSLKSGR